MADYCERGEFGTYKLTTARDRELCIEGGGSVVSRPEEGSSGGCAGGTVQNFSGASGQSLNVASVRTAASIFASTDEAVLLRKLSSAAVPAVASILRSDPKKSERIIAAAQRIESIAAMLLNPDFTDILYTEDDHRTFLKLARDIAKHATDSAKCAPDSRFPELLEAATHVAERFQGVRASDVREKLGGLPELADQPIGKAELLLGSPASDFALYQEMPSIAWRNHTRVTELVSESIDYPSVLLEFQKLLRAEKAIAAKAHSLGSLASSPQGDVTVIDGGYVRRFAGCDIYYSDETGAHEIHGEIRRKYWTVSGPTRLGLPTTDETGCPDGRGRFNHFAKSASIYWTNTTGPFYAKNTCRFRWASLGWERSFLGYPVQDEESFTAAYPGGGPTMYWSHFQNGIVFGRGPDAQPARAAVATRQQVLDALRQTIDRRMPSFDLDVGLFSYNVRGGLFGIDFLGVDDWRYSFYGAIPRVLRIRVNGFVSVPIVSDPTFQIEMALQFSTRWPLQSFFYPTYKKIVATLLSTRISVQGIASDYIAGMIKDAIWSAFKPGPADPEITDNSMVLATVPTGANQTPGKENLDFLDIMLMADGSLNVYVNPLPDIAGAFRQTAAQNVLNNTLQNL